MATVTKKNYIWFKGNKVYDGDGLTIGQSWRFTSVTRQVCPTIKAANHDAGVCLMINDEEN